MLVEGNLWELKTYFLGIMIMKSVIVYDIPKMWMSCNLLVVKFVEDILEFILGFEGLFLFIFYTLPRIINQQTCVSSLNE